jgi:hypothetical protein
MSGTGSHTWVTPAGFSISAVVVTSNTRHWPGVVAAAKRGSPANAVAAGTSALLFRKALLSIDISLIGLS